MYDLYSLSASYKKQVYLNPSRWNFSLLEQPWPMKRD